MMAPIPKLVSGFVRALKNRAKKNVATNKQTLPPPPNAAPSTATEPFTEGAPFQVAMYIDKFNTVLRVKLPKVNAEKICAGLIQKGDLIHEMKNIFSFHTLDRPLHLQYDDHHAFWDILIHTQAPDRQNAILEWLASKKELFNLKKPPENQIPPLPPLQTEMKESSAKMASQQPPKTQATKANKPNPQEAKKKPTQPSQPPKKTETVAAAPKVESVQPNSTVPTSAEKKEAAPEKPSAAPSAPKVETIQEKPITPVAAPPEKKEATPEKPPTAPSAASKVEAVQEKPLAPAAASPEKKEATSEKPSTAPSASKVEAVQEKPLASAAPTEKKEATPEKPSTAPSAPKVEAVQEKPSTPIATSTEKKEATPEKPPTTPSAPKIEAVQEKPITPVAAATEKKEATSEKPPTEPKVEAVQEKPLAPAVVSTEKKEATPEKPSTALSALQVVKEKTEKEVLFRKKYEDFAEKIKNLFPQGSLTVHIKEKEEEIQLAFGTNANLCKIVRKNLEDYKKTDKIDMGNNFTLPCSNKLILLLKDERQVIWKEVFKQYATALDEKKVEKKSPLIIVKRNTAGSSTNTGTRIGAPVFETLSIKAKTPSSPNKEGNKNNPERSPSS